MIECLHLLPKCDKNKFLKKLKDMIGIDPKALDPLHEMLKDVGAKELQESTEQLIFLWTAYAEWRNFWITNTLKSKEELWNDLQKMENYFKRIDHEGIELVWESLKSLNEVFAAHTLVELKCNPVENSVNIFLEGLEELFRMVVENPNEDGDQRD